MAADAALLRCREMRLRVVGPLLALALVGAACGGGGSTGAATGTTGSATGTTGAATGTTVSTTVAKFTVVVQDVDGGNTLSFSGVSCDGIDGPYDVTIAVQGNVTGESAATFTFDATGASTMNWSMDVTGSAGTGTLSGAYTVTISPVQDSQVIVFKGVTTAKGPDGTRTFDVQTDDVPVDEGTGACGPG